MQTKRRTPERTQQERSETTSRALVKAARTLFASAGYAATSLDDIALKAGVTKGALYHHFAGKRELFEAVFVAEQRRLARVVAEAFSKEADPWKGFYAGCRTFLEACLDPEVQRVVLLDAPGILGWTETRRIENDHCYMLLREGLHVAMGSRTRRPLDALSHLLHGAICEGAMMAARADDPRSATKDVLTELRRMLDGLKDATR